MLCVINIYSKYAWVIPLKHKIVVTGSTVTNAFPKILKESNRNPSKIWVDKGSAFYNRSMRSWLQMYSTNNERTSVVTERLMRTLKK